jgi:hypothetical protein
VFADLAAQRACWHPVAFASEVAGRPVHTDDHVLRYEIVRPEAPNSEEFPVFGNEDAGPPERRSRYELHLPYTIVLRLGWGGQWRWPTVKRCATSAWRTCT